MASRNPKYQRAHKNKYREKSWDRAATERDNKHCSQRLANYYQNKRKK